MQAWALSEGHAFSGSRPPQVTSILWGGMLPTKALPLKLAATRPLVIAALCRVRPGGSCPGRTCRFSELLQEFDHRLLVVGAQLPEAENNLARVAAVGL